MQRWCVHLLISFDIFIRNLEILVIVRDIKVSKVKFPYFLRGISLFARSGALLQASVNIGFDPI